MRLLDFFEGSRKFTVMVSIIAISTVFRYFNLLSSPDFAQLLSATGVAFMGSNAVEHVMTAAKDWVASKASSPEEKEDV